MPVNEDVKKVIRESIMSMLKKSLMGVDSYLIGLSLLLDSLLASLITKVGVSIN